MYLPMAGHHSLVRLVVSRYGRYLGLDEHWTVGIHSAYH